MDLLVKENERIGKPLRFGHDSCLQTSRRVTMIMISSRRTSSSPGAWHSAMSGSWSHAATSRRFHNRPRASSASGKGKSDSSASWWARVACSRRGVRRFRRGERWPPPRSDATSGSEVVRAATSLLPSGLVVGAFPLAGPPGFEPGLTDPESAGLPLPHGPVGDLR